MPFSSEEFQEIQKEIEEEREDEANRMRALLMRQYSNPAHFILEILQNTEDALWNRKDSTYPKTINFSLEHGQLKISHFGEPFSKKDTKSISVFGASTKGAGHKGKFGVGFKSVYNYTHQPSIHSGPRHFTIKSGDIPRETDPINMLPGETVIILPLMDNKPGAYEDIANGLQSLGVRPLLFLSEIEKITWATVDGRRGYYTCSAEVIDEDKNVKKVTLTTQEEGHENKEEIWLVFSEHYNAGKEGPPLFVEIAFSIENEKGNDSFSVFPCSDSKLFSWFPTKKETHMGFLIQGPYDLTPNREGSFEDEPENQKIISKTADLLIESLRWLRNRNLLDINVLQCLPLDKNKFAEDGFFAPLYERCVLAFNEESFLPCYGGGYAVAKNSMLADRDWLRELFSPEHLAYIYNSKDERELYWLNGDISGRNDLRLFVSNVLNVEPVVSPASIVSKLDKKFLEDRSDSWTAKFYKCLAVSGFQERWKQSRPIIRLQNGEHICAFDGKLPQAFLPRNDEPGQNTVKVSICQDEEVRKALENFGLAEEDIVDVVIREILSKYKGNSVAVDKISQDEYQTDMKRILDVSLDTSVSVEKRQQFFSELKNTAFIKVIDAGNNGISHKKPSECYFKLRELFEGVEGVWLVDESYGCFQDKRMFEFIKDCGAYDYVRPIESTGCLLSGEERAKEKEKLRDKLEDSKEYAVANYASTTDFHLQGVEELLDALPSFDSEARSKKAELLWRSLCDLSRQSRSFFTRKSMWKLGRANLHIPTSDVSQFVRLLNAREWVPMKNGELAKPGQVLFEELNWRAEPVLRDKIYFQSSEFAALAEKRGFEDAALHFLKERGLTTVAALSKHFGSEPSNFSSDSKAEQVLAEGNDIPSEQIGDNTGGNDPLISSGGGFADSKSGGQSTGLRSGTDAKRMVSEGGASSHGRGSSAKPGRKRFVSYIAVDQEEDETNPEGLTHDEGLTYQQRMNLEKGAIKFIIGKEPALQETPKGNKGFDLYEKNAAGDKTRWVEVKSMRGSFSSHPVGMTKAQFELAWEKREKFWLYVVEHADSENPEIIPIQDPAGRAQTFTFDEGWAKISEAEE